MKIFVTGGGGFIGSFLLGRVSSHYDLVCIDHGLKYPRLKKTINRSVKLVVGDFYDETLLDRFLTGSDVVLHLAGGGGNTACIRDPLWAIKNYVTGTRILLEKAKKYKIKRFFLFSSIAVYAKTKKGDISKENTIPKPDSIYGMLKLCSEILLKESNIPYIILRLANVYGYTPNDLIQVGGALGNFIKASVENKPIIISGDGKQAIDYIHIKDVCRAIELLLGDSKIVKQTINLASGRLEKVEGIACLVARLSSENFNLETNIHRIPNSTQINSGLNWHISINKAKRMLGWKPLIPFEEGVKEMLVNFIESKKIKK